MEKQSIPLWYGSAHTMITGKYFIARMAFHYDEIIIQGIFIPLKKPNK
jgi:hypothetical protein